MAKKEKDPAVKADELFIPRIGNTDTPDGIASTFSWRLISIARLYSGVLDDHLRGSGLTAARWRTLAWARMLPGVRQADLAERMRIAGATLVPILDGLEQQGLVERREASGDRRVREIWLTDAALPLVEKISLGVTEVRDKLLGDIPLEDLQTCMRVFEHIHKKAAELDQK